MILKLMMNKVIRLKMYEINLFKLKLIFVFFESLYKPYKIEKELNICSIIMELNLKSF